MRISTPVTSKARKHRVVIQCVTRTRAECREGTVLAGRAAAEVATQAESRIRNATKGRPVAQAGWELRGRRTPSLRRIGNVTSLSAIETALARTTCLRPPVSSEAAPPRALTTYWE